ncbi:hypothetical protein IF2G_08178 [Cordyceps javanica]|nr:hypothetical protein IF2G_08178 [Cordyceps javanica]
MDNISEPDNSFQRWMKEQDARHFVSRLISPPTRSSQRLQPTVPAIHGDADSPSIRAQYNPFPSCFRKSSSVAFVNATLRPRLPSAHYCW